MGNADAPSNYSFDFHFPEGTRVVPDAEGGCDIDLPGAVDGHLFPRWAKDSEGRSLPTRFLIGRDAYVMGASVIWSDCASNVAKIP